MTVRVNKHDGVSLGQWFTGHTSHHNSCLVALDGTLVALQSIFPIKGCLPALINVPSVLERSREEEEEEEEVEEKGGCTCSRALPDKFPPFCDLDDVS